VTELILPGIVVAASLALTYVFCLRPMRRGQCGMSRVVTSAAPVAEDRDAEVAALRAEVAALRAATAENRSRA
jgi:hypothetical protein